MSDDVRDVLRAARRWVEQERQWDSSLYASTAEAAAQITLERPLSTPRLAPSALIPPNVSEAPPMSFPATSLAASIKSERLLALYEKYKDCVRCPLGRTRIKIVFGVGSPEAQVLFIGEGPGYEEDRRGEPFVGKAGQLLDKIMASIGLSRQANAYIANIVKCHPMTNPQTPEARGNDRPPTPHEVETCAPILLQQIAIIQPRVIVTLGSPSTRMILRTKDGITSLRGRFAAFPVDEFFPSVAASSEESIDTNTRERLRSVRVLPTYHPAALLRNPNLKGDTWTDMKLLRDTLTAG